MSHTKEHIEVPDTHVVKLINAINTAINKAAQEQVERLNKIKGDGVSVLDPKPSANNNEHQNQEQ